MNSLYELSSEEEILYDNIWAYIIIAIFPIMAFYSFLPAFSLGYLFLFILIVYKLVIYKFFVNLNYQFLFLMLYFIITNLVVGVLKYSSVSNTINNSFAMILFTIAGSFLYVPENYNFDRAYTVFKNIGVVATIFLLIQLLLYYGFGIVLKGAIPFLKLEETSFFYSITYGRPTSFFTEPAHYTIFIAPIYAVTYIKKEYGYFVFFLLGLLLSTSSTGYFFVVFIPLLVLMQTREKVVIKVLIFVAGILILVATPEDIFMDVFGKFSFYALLNNPRILGTLYYFRAFDNMELLFGIGYNRLSEMLINNLISLTAESNYSNAFVYSFISFGLVGGIVWIGYMVALFIRINKKYVILFFILLFVCMTDQVLFNRNLFYVMWWVTIVSNYSANNEDMDENFTQIGDK